MRQKEIPDAFYLKWEKHINSNWKNIQKLKLCLLFFQIQAQFIAA